MHTKMNVRRSRQVDEGGRSRQADKGGRSRQVDEGGRSRHAQVSPSSQGPGQALRKADIPSYLPRRASAPSHGHAAESPSCHVAYRPARGWRSMIGWMLPLLGLLAPQLSGTVQTRSLEPITPRTGYIRSPNLRPSYRSQPHQPVTPHAAHLSQSKPAAPHPAAAWKGLIQLEYPQPPKRDAASLTNLLRPLVRRR